MSKGSAGGKGWSLSCWNLIFAPEKGCVHSPETLRADICRAGYGGALLVEYPFPGQAKANGPVLVPF